MGKIIYCSDIIVRVDDHQEINNVTDFFMSSTDFRPAYPNDCVVRTEMSSMGKLGVIMVVWGALIVLTTVYCYFCEERLFPKQKLADKFPSGCVGCDKVSSSTSSTCLSTPNRSPPSSPTEPPLSKGLPNSDLFKSSSSQSSLLSSSLSCHNAKVCMYIYQNAQNGSRVF